MPPAAGARQGPQCGPLELIQAPSCTPTGPPSSCCCSPQSPWPSWWRSLLSSFGGKRRSAEHFSGNGHGLVIVGSDGSNAHADQAGAVGIRALTQHPTTPTSGAGLLLDLLGGGAHGDTSLIDSSVNNSGPNDPEHFLKKCGGTERHDCFGINRRPSGVNQVPSRCFSSLSNSSALSSAP